MIFSGLMATTNVLNFMEVQAEQTFCDEVSGLLPFAPAVLNILLGSSFTQK